MTTKIALKPAEIAFGVDMASEAEKLQAALDVLKQQELRYIELLRVQYGLGPEWVITNWIDGWQTRAGNGHQNDQSAN